jgi:hypothetical protein
MLKVMSGMNPYMICVTWDGFGLIGFVEVGSLGWGSFTVRLRNEIKIVIRGDEVVIYLLEYLRHIVNFCMSNLSLAILDYLLEYFWL